MKRRVAEKKMLMFLVVVITAIAFTQKTGATILLGTTGTGGDISTLVEIDPTTGVLIHTIGSIGYAVNGLKYDATNGKLYGSTSINDPLYNGLIEIDAITGAGTPIGVHQWGLVSMYTAVNNITINSTGQMYGWWEPAQDDLVSINKNTGIATLVGEASINTAEEGMAFDECDVLYLVNNNGKVYTVDTGTGVATYINNIGATAHHGDFDFSSGLYYGITTAQTNPKSLVVVDLATGSVVSTLPTVDNLHTLTFSGYEPIPPEPIPEPTTIILMGFGLVGLLGVVIRQRLKSK